MTHDSLENISVFSEKLNLKVEANEKVLKWGFDLLCTYNAKPTLKELICH